MKKFLTFTVLLLSVATLTACSSKAKTAHHELSGEFYGSKTDTTLDFEKGKDWLIYQTELPTGNGTVTLTGNFDYTMSGDKITIKWGNKYDKKYGFKPGEVLGEGRISKDNQTITITKDKSDKNTRHAQYYDFLDPSFGKNNQAAKKAKTESSSSKAAENKWKTEAQDFIDKTVKTNENAAFTFSKADYDALFADDYYGATKGAKGTNITDVLAKYPTVNTAMPGFSEDGQLILGYGKSDSSRFVQLEFVRQNNGSYTLVEKTESGLK
ncbi:hypothetical protein ACFO26_05165 [Lactococcus nasutitermitis]|uniref:Lipoprotein n=1 Tax=Lactococcus nasutitermitis TaxID=1652957 RepID=A0ABV9JCP0_9LACT|nr:hypothetical protein [Lactococcus nasutitermitis]